MFNIKSFINIDLLRKADRIEQHHDCDERDYCVDCGCILTSHESETLCRSCEQRKD